MLKKRMMLWMVAIFIIMLCGCGIDDNDDDSCRGITPVITDVTFHDCYDDCNKTDYINETYEFSSGDCFDYIILATDCNLDMATLHMWWCYGNECTYYSSPLPEQMNVERGYHLAKCGIMPTEPGIYNVEFQIEDHEGHISDSFDEVEITVY